TLAIAPQPELSIAPQFLAFSYFHGGDVPAAVNLNFLRFGMQFAVTASTSDTWLSVDPSTPTSSGPIEVAVSPAALNAGAYHGFITLTVTDSSGAIVVQRKVPVDLYVDMPTDPRITLVSNAMSFLSTPLAPGLIFSVFGTGLGPSTPVTAQMDDGGLVLARSLGGVQVLVNGIACPILYASTTQINAIAPYALYTKESATLVVTNKGVASNEMPVNVSPTSPGIFSMNFMGS